MVTAGRTGSGLTVDGLTVSVADEVRQADQRLGGWCRTIRWQSQASSTSAAARSRLSSMPSSCGKVSFAAVGVLGDPFADGGLGAGHVEQVVGDLKRQAEVAGRSA